MRERELIRNIARRAGSLNPLLKKGIGDDCAIFRSLPGSDWLVTADMLVDNVHFDRSWHSPYLLGRKSLAVNISDIAAMGGIPQFAILGLALPAGCDEHWTTEYMDGFFSLLQEYECALIGGDTVSAAAITLSVTVIGTVEQGRAIGRDGARPGDSVYVSGCLGSAAAGLHLFSHKLTGDGSGKATDFPALRRQHLDPVPQVQLGRVLRESGMVTAMQDISDGIATDLGHICSASSVTAVVEAGDLPAHDELLAMCGQLQLDPLEFQLRGGEDYELLFTVRAGSGEQLAELVLERTGKEIYRIGRIEEGQGGVMLSRSGSIENIAFQGYEHRS